jgi:4a-hydroxytetrahydrobiopterin dehydratase
MIVHELELAVESLDGWHLVKTPVSAIEKSFQFPDFKHAWAFMNYVALHAEAMNHHPHWSNIYNRVHIQLSTHDAVGLSAKDIALAQAIDAYFNDANKS